MADEQNLEDKYMQLQMLQQQTEQIADYVGKLQGQKRELDTSIEALVELQKTKLNTEILAPVASGIFLKAELKENQKLIINIGAEAAAEKSIPEVLALLEEQKVKITENIAEAEGILEELHKQSRKFYHEIGKVEE